MLIDLNQPIRDLGGAPLTTPGRDGQPHELTLKVVLLTALLHTDPQGENLKEHEKLARYELARQLYRKDEYDLDEFEAAGIQCNWRFYMLYLINSAYPSPMIVGQANELLRPNETPMEDN